MVTDFCGKCKVSATPIALKCDEIERVEERKCLGVINGNIWKFKKHLQSVEQRLKSGMYCLLKLNSFMVNSDILALQLCQLGRVNLLYNLLCWAGNKDKDTN